MLAPPHILNWWFGWGMLLAAFVTGAAIGLRFHEPDFWGGYASFRRRIVRLGHIALAALGMVNLIYSLSPWPASGLWQGRLTSICFAAGGIAMPVVCFLSGWREGFRQLFFVPVVLLVAAVIATLWGAI